MWLCDFAQTRIAKACALGAGWPSGCAGGPYQEAQKSAVRVGMLKRRGGAEEHGGGDAGGDAQGKSQAGLQRMPASSAPIPPPSQADGGGGAEVGAEGRALE